MRYKICTVRVALWLAFFSGLYNCVHARQAAPPTTVANIALADTGLDLYLLIGQSNMAGRGEITAPFKTQGNDRVLMLNKEGQWVGARHPLHFDKPAVVGVGPGLSFGMAMAKRNGGHKIGLIPCAVGGSPIDTWRPGMLYGPTRTHPYDDAVERLKLALKSGKLKGVIWLQGEADSSPEKAAVYLAALQGLIERLRLLVNNPQLPFVAGEIGRFRPEYLSFNAVLNGLPKLMPFTAVAGSGGLNDMGEQTHFDSPSADKYGRRFAAKMRKLQHRLPK